MDGASKSLVILYVVVSCTKLPHSSVTLIVMAALYESPSSNEYTAVAESDCPVITSVSWSIPTADVYVTFVRLQLSLKDSVSVPSTAFPPMPLP